MEQPFYQVFLQDEFTRRREKNPSYSLRSFAKMLSLSPGNLSEILNGKRVPSFTKAQSLIETLSLSPQQQQSFIDSVVDAQKARNLKRVSPEIRHFERLKMAPKSIDIQLYRLIGDWYHFAILQLVHQDDFQNDPQWIARELGIGRHEAKQALARLFRLELLIEENGVTRRTSAQLTTADKNITTPALKKKQRQARELAIDSLENDPIEERSMTTMTMCIDPELLPEAKKRIEKFQNELAEFLTEKSQRQVYMLEVGLFPLQKRK